MDKISVSRAEEKYKRLIMIFLNFSEHERQKTDRSQKKKKKAANNSQLILDPDKFRNLGSLLLVLF